MTDNLTVRYLIIAVIVGGAITAISMGWPPTLGIDLRGGTVLTYEVEPVKVDETRPGDAGLDGPVDANDLEDTISVISERINSEGVKDIQIRAAGTRQIRIELPDMSTAEAEEIKRRMTQVGSLEFPVIAQDGDIGRDGRSFTQSTFDQQRKTMLEDHFKDANKDVFRPGASFSWVATRPEPAKDESKDDYASRLEEYRTNMAERPWEVDGVWAFYDPEYWGDPELGKNGFTGDDIFDAIRDIDQNGKNAVSFRVKPSAQNTLASYTDKYRGRQLALVLNGELWSAPNIGATLSDNVQIHGGSGIGFTEEDQGWLIKCLQGGSLKLKPKLLSTEEIGASLGQQSIKRGTIAFIIGFILIIGFMLGYYRAGGVIAVLALAVNFTMIFAILIILDASLSLPGIAGLVLTVGMAVDASILIFERIREELGKGKTLLHAAKNGFDRAFVTIFDANLTTFIVAAFLVKYGQGPVKGFGYTLMTGIVCTMFSALFFARTLMGWAIKSGVISDLKMGSVLAKTRIAFSTMARRALTMSLAVIVVGIGFSVISGDDKYGIDFRGGTAVRVRFESAKTQEEVLDAVASIQGEDGAKYKAPEATLIAPEGGKSTQIDIRLDYVPPTSKEEVADGEGENEFKVIEEELRTIFAGQLAKDSLDEVTFELPDKWAGTLNLLSGFSDAGKLEEIARTAGVRNAKAEESDGGLRWKISGNVNAANRGAVEAKLIGMASKVSDVEVSSPFPKSLFLGPNVVADLKGSAIKSMLVSLLFILAYIWFRFKELKYGLAAAAALIHDVLVSFGVVVLFNYIGLVSVPITLNTIAAFLTIIGYSLNDTIVVFDRVRENLGNVQGRFSEVVDRSINQTLSRTILTSVTTFLVISAIFLLNYGIESPLEGFAFTLAIGVVVGTYSSIFVASPVLIWLDGRAAKKEAAAKSLVQA